MRILFFDTETTGLPKNWNAPVSDLNNWPRLVQLAWQVYNEDQELLEEFDFIIKPNGFTIPQNASEVHKITTEKANEQGVDLIKVLQLFFKSSQEAKLLIAHNYDYDYSIMASEFLRNGFNNILENKDFICTMKSTVDFCKISGPYGYKWPKLEELYSILFDAYFNAHNALDDIKATARCFWELKNKNIINIPDFFDKINHSSIVLNSGQDIFFKSNNWDSIQIIVREIELKTEVLSISIERDLIYKYFSLRESVHKCYESIPLIHWFSIAEQLRYDSWGWGLPGNFHIDRKYKGYDFSWVESTHLKIPSELHNDEMSLGIRSWMDVQFYELPIHSDWVFIGSETNGDFDYGSSSPHSIASYYFISKEKLHKYFENLRKDEIDRLIDNIINETSYKIFNWLRGGRTWITFEEKQIIRVFPENYDYYFSIKNKNLEILSANFKYQHIINMRKEKSGLDSNI